MKSEMDSSEEEDLRELTSKKKNRLIPTSPHRGSPIGNFGKFRNDMSPGTHAKIVYESDTKEGEDFKWTKIEIDDLLTNTSYKSAAPSVELWARTIDGNDNPGKQIVKIKSSEYRTIRKIIYISFNKFAKKNTVQSSSKDAQSVKIKSNTQSDHFLNRKLLNIGKSGSPSACLLKYLKNRSLKIVWVPNKGKENAYFGINTKFEKKGEDNLRDFHICNICPWTLKSLDSSSAIASKIVPASVVPTVTYCRNDPVLDPIEAEELSITALQMSYKPDSMQCDCNDLQDDDLQLFNTNSVANPKQVSNKKNTLEMINKLGVCSPRTASETAQISITNNPDACMYNDWDDDEQNTDSNMKMPIITSIKSLVEDVQAEEQVDSSTISKTMAVKFEPVAETNATTKTVAETKNVTSDTVSDLQSKIPRIRCKPVSELLAATVINKPLTDSRVPQDQDPVKQQSNETTALPQCTLPAASAFPVFTTADINKTETRIRLPNNIISTPNSNTELLTKKELVVLMDSLTLPRTMTSSPFAYVKKVMKINNIHLMEINSKFSKNFVCLIKFRLNAEQDKRTILLYFSLHTYNDAFCIKFQYQKDEYKRLEIKPVFWEWEVLKAFQDDTVASKTLERAKSVSEDVHAFAQKFLTILKTVECKSPLEPCVT